MADLAILVLLALATAAALGYVLACGDLTRQPHTGPDSGK